MYDKRFPANIISSTPVEPTGPLQDDAASGTWSLQEAFSYVKAGLWPTAGNQKPLIEDLFSTYLWTGTSVARDIVNGIDLAGEGGLTWIKWRSGVNLVGNLLFNMGYQRTLGCVTDLTNPLCYFVFVCEKWVYFTKFGPVF